MIRNDVMRQFSLRLPLPLWDWVAEIAEREERSANEIIVRLLKAAHREAEIAADPMPAKETDRLNYRAE